MITDDMIRCWQVNYGLDKRSPADAGEWWQLELGHAPASVVTALGMCLDEIKRLQRALRDHLNSESAETMRADALRSERDSWQALAAAADADAQRYRYLRNRNRDDVLLMSGPSAGVWCDCEDENGDLILLTGEDLDAAIDAALAREEK